jgi:hypothetical protein
VFGLAGVAGPAGAGVEDVLEFVDVFLVVFFSAGSQVGESVSNPLVLLALAEVLPDPAELAVSGEPAATQALNFCVSASASFLLVGMVPAWMALSESSAASDAAAYVLKFGGVPFAP